VKVHYCEQGTTAWLEARKGIPTASEFHQIVTPKKLAASGTFTDYLYDLLAERIMGRPRMSELMVRSVIRGKELEPAARSYYEFSRNVTVEQVGFITNDEGTVGASPDGLVGDDGLLEIKCPSDEGLHVRHMLTERGQSLEEKYGLQLQGQLWIAEREWVDVVSFHPEMPEACFRVVRRPEVIAALEKHVGEFVRVLENYAREFAERGWIKEAAAGDKMPDVFGSEFIADADLEWARTRTI
jgi:hypothetical protein